MNSQDDVLNYVEEERVKFIRLACFDLHGLQKNVSVMPGQLGRVFEKGITIDGSKIFNHCALQVDDLILRPDPTTMTPLPWRSMENGVIHMIGDLFRPDGTPFEGDMRALLKNEVRALAADGIDVLMASKFQFYLFERDENGRPTRTPFDNGGYMDVAPADGGENIRREICLILEEMGFDPHKSYHQEGPGQNEIDFHFSDPLSAADEASLFRWVVKTAAASNGLYADFSPCPLENQPGSALHIQVRFLEDDGSAQEAFLAGLLRYLPDLQVFFNPVSQSYRRLAHPSSPKKADYSATRRNVMVRRPPLAADVLEVRLADSQANPYLTFAMVLKCGRRGIEEGLSWNEPAAKLESGRASSLERLARAGIDLGLDEHVIAAFLEDEADRC